MLTFYYHNSNGFSERIKDKLEEMVVAHKMVRVNGEDDLLPGSVSEADLPVLFDGHNSYSSREIESYLDELHQELQQGRSMQSDACFLDPDNPGECL